MVIPAKNYRTNAFHYQCRSVSSYIKLVPIIRQLMKKLHEISVLRICLWYFSALIAVVVTFRLTLHTWKLFN